MTEAKSIFERKSIALAFEMNFVNRYVEVDIMYKVFDLQNKLLESKVSKATHSRHSSGFDRLISMIILCNSLGVDSVPFEYEAVEESVQMHRSES